MSDLRRTWESPTIATLKTAGFFLIAVAIWAAVVGLGLFDRLHDHTDGHEEFVEKALFLLVNLAVAAIVTLIVQSRALKRAILERNLEHDRAEANTRHDPLTGLMNRRALAASLQDLLRGPQSDRDRILATIDLDRFKPVNDLHGHAAGDMTLQIVADRLRQEAESCSAIARLGGDEFCIVFGPNVSAAEAERIVRRIQTSIQQPIYFGHATILISASIGLALAGAFASKAITLEHADKALMLAKQQGRNRSAWYDSDLDRASKDRAQLEVDLRGAIARSEIQPWFQPIVRIDSRALIGFEVLARWRHPKRGMIGPSTFIELAEECGMIEELGRKILSDALLEAKNWNEGLTLSVNMSPRQFRDRGFTQHIRDILESTRFDPKRLTIEVTESSVIHDLDMARTTLEELKAMGLGVALDDFGIGYSSLASLKQLPFDRIKIDRSFVTNIAKFPDNQKIVSGILALASGLDLDVTAEGIETEDDLKFLQEQACTLGQGYLFEKAIPAQQVAWLLETQWQNLVVEPEGEATQTPQLSQTG